MYPKPRIHYLLDKTERLLVRRKAVTLIAGLLCVDGVLLFSDREENAGYLSKRSVRKIHECLYGPWSMCIATSGRSSLADLASRQIMAKARISGADFPDRHATVITDALIEVMDKHVFRKGLPDSEKRHREIELIIGICNSDTGYPYLYKTEAEILCPCDDFACAGYGEDIATYFLERLFDQALRCEEAEILARFILREAKESVQTVGKETETVTISRSDALVVRNKFSLMADALDVPRHLTHCIQPFWKKTKPDGKL